MVDTYRSHVLQSTQHVSILFMRYHPKSPDDELRKAAFTPCFYVCLQETSEHTAASVYILSEVAVHSLAPREERRAAYVKSLEIQECIRNTKMSEEFNVGWKLLLARRLQLIFWLKHGVAIAGPSQIGVLSPDTWMTPHEQYWLIFYARENGYHWHPLGNKSFHLWTTRRENVICIVVRSKWVNFQFWLNYSFKESKPGRVSYIKIHNENIL